MTGTTSIIPTAVIEPPRPKKLDPAISTSLDTAYEALSFLPIEAVQGKLAIRMPKMLH